MSKEGNYKEFFTVPTNFTLLIYVAFLALVGIGMFKCKEINVKIYQLGRHGKIEMYGQLNYAKGVSAFFFLSSLTSLSLAPYIESISNLVSV